MRYVRLGSSGLKVSRVALGMMSYGAPSALSWSLDRDRAEPIVRRAVEAGVTFFDTADMYGDGAGEEVTGRLLRALFARRDDYVLATKVYYPMGPGPNDGGLSRKHIMSAVDASLTRLGTDHIDLYQVHRWDAETPIEETMAALDDLVRSGKVRYAGASLMYAWQFAKAQHAAERHGLTRFVSMQTRYNLLYREEEREMLPLCADQRVGVLPYSPLARGVLAATGPRDTDRAAAERGRSRSIDGDDLVIGALRAIAAERGLPPAQIALAWTLAHPTVSASIVGATRTGHVDDAVAAVDVALTPAEKSRLEEHYRPRTPYGHT
ncbi:aldo/keto reductase [Microbispora sp. KK1-11]|uniref:aldo/keto reductase n=1 Tax=Microbispora sp. KK1-11 TaxID=2053005 RepID=UPI0011584C9B|nr:aldo/keto reductase [Microbispora sp. KK1-11]TQS22784.1 aldo/keto reductase [Microbispora sp. KK1-11]